MSEPAFAEILNEALLAHAVSPGQAARLLGIHRSNVYRWLEGVTPSPRHLARLADLPRLLGMSPAEKARYLNDLAAALGYDVPMLPAGPPPSPIPHRRHLGADDLPPFAGRAAELAALQRIVLRRESVLISGAGGMGKTPLESLPLLCRPRPRTRS